MGGPAVALGLVLGALVALVVTAVLEVVNLRKQLAGKESVIRTLLVVRAELQHAVFDLQRGDAHTFDETHFH